jgi:hypothetical protein
MACRTLSAPGRSRTRVAGAAITRAASVSTVDLAAIASRKAVAARARRTGRAGTPISADVAMTSGAGKIGQRARTVRFKRKQS